MDISDIKTYLAGPMAEVSALMDESLKSDIALLDATNRSLLSQGGKMLRPVLSLLAAGACGGIQADSIRFAAASELIHNSTLLHDDVVDGASQRRGFGPCVQQEDPLVQKAGSGVGPLPEIAGKGAQPNMAEEGPQGDVGRPGASGLDMRFPEKARRLGGFFFQAKGLPAKVSVIADVQVGGGAVLPAREGHQMVIPVEGNAVGGRAALKLHLLAGIQLLSPILPKIQKVYPLRSL